MKEFRIHADVMEESFFIFRSCRRFCVVALIDEAGQLQDKPVVAARCGHNIKLC